jgi:Uma2 family endonuclease
MATNPDLDDANHYEVIDGQPVQMPPRSVLAGLITSELACDISVFGIAHNLGKAIAYGLIRLPHATDPYRCRRPDISFVSFARWPADRPMSLTAEAWDVVPDLAIEVVSPHDQFKDVLEKVFEYFEAGVRLVWVILPRYRKAYVYESLNEMHQVNEAGTLDGGAVLPGFRLPLNRLFNPVAPSSTGA